MSFCLERKKENDFCSIKRYVKDQKSSTHCFVEHARLPVFICSFRTINETIAQNMVIYATIAALSIWGRTSKSFHAIRCGWTFCNTQRKKRWTSKLRWRNNLSFFCPLLSLKYFMQPHGTCVRAKFFNFFILFFEWVWSKKKRQKLRRGERISSFNSFLDTLRGKKIAKESLWKI